MALSDAEKQRRRRDRLKDKGFVHVQGWVMPAQAEAIKAIMQNKSVTYRAEGQTVIYHQPLAPEPEPAHEQPASTKQARAGPGRRTTSGSGGKKSRSAS
ncbi:MAG: hypothetical protein M3Z21_02015 [Pseudomonadota bacterium]|nr:hypothetical protein [Pseudomonadota bacterium]